jgi:eukaryotic-like serine/threonine-protein kinase
VEAQTPDPGHPTRPPASTLNETLTQEADPAPTPPLAEGSKTANEDGDRIEPQTLVGPDEPNLPESGTPDTATGSTSTHPNPTRAPSENSGDLYQPASDTLDDWRSLPPPLPAVAEEVSPALPLFPVIPGYEILGELGRGGMGVVYKACQTQLKRLVALKMISGASPGSEAMARFRAEAEAVARLHHPHIVQIYEVGEHQGLPFFSLEFVEGGSLDRQLRGTPLSIRRAADLVRILAEAMQAAHDKGIIHRDLKPANILLTVPDPSEAPTLATSLPAGSATLGLPKISDFGLAKQLDADGSQTRSGAIMGTPNYMAPEQAEGRIKDIGPWTDVYALGAILYELLTGRPPFNAQSTWDTLDQVRTREPVAPHQLQPGCPRDLETICLKCLRKDAAGRYLSARALADDLSRFLAGQPITARPVGPATRAIKWARRRPAVAALVAVCVLAGMGLTAAIPWHISQLHAAFDRATSEVNRLRDQEREERERRRRVTVRAECQLWVSQGQEHLAHGDSPHLREAVGLFTRARDRIADEDTRKDPDLKDLRENASRKLADAEGLLNRLDDIAKAHETARTFFALRDEAFFQLHRGLVAGVDAARPEACEASARKALALFGVTPDARQPGPVKLDLEAHDRTERERLRAGVCEVLLILAEAVAAPRPKQASPERQRTAEALAILESAAALTGPSRTIHQRRARYLARLGKKAEAEQEASRAAGLQPQSPLDWFLVGYDEWFENGNVPKALRAFDEALRLQPDLFWAQFLRAIGYLKLRNLSEARASLTACSRDRPNFPWIYLLRGFLQGQLGDDRAAEDDFQRVEALSPDEFARYVLHMNRGVLALRGGKPDRAVREFQEGLPLRPDLYHGHENLALAYLAQKKPDLAAKELNEAIRLAPGRSVLYRTRAELHRHLLEDAAALKDLDRALQLEPRGPGAARDHLERGRILYRGERYQEVLRACAAALKEAAEQGRPERNPPWSRPPESSQGAGVGGVRAAAHRLQGEALLKLGKPREAAAAFDRALAEGKPDRVLFLRRALAHGEISDYAALVDDYTRALAFGPDGLLFAARGWAYLMNEAPKLALRDFEAALPLLHDSADAHAGRGLARAQTGDHRLAVEDAREALRLGPRSSRLLYNAGRIYALAAGAVAADPKQQDARGQETRLLYQDQAVQLLRDALGLFPVEKRLPFWQDNVARDPALRALHHNPRFRLLAEEFSRPGR